ncbi:MAG: hypothetical protein R3F29_05980 [Planctomycetota bacterium]
MRSLLPLAAIICAATLTAQSPFTSHFIANSGQAGNMFDVEATNPAGITVRYFDVNVDAGTWDFEVYKKNITGTYDGSQNIAADWTLVGSVTGVVGNGFNVATTLPIQVCEYIAPGTIQAFYVTCSNGTGLNYLIGTAGTTGTIYGSNADLNFYAGAGIAYPFAGNFNPRIWSGNIYYSVGPNPGCTVSFAEVNAFGTGSYNDPRMVRELWAPNSAVDLANTSWTLSFVPDSLGGHYNIAAGGIPYDNITPPILGTDLVQGAYDTSSSGTWDDASKTIPLDPGQFPTGFPYPNGAGASATEISVNSNGRIYLGSHTDAGFNSNGANSLLTPGIFQGTLGAGLPVLAALMCDMDPTDINFPGRIWVDTGPAGGLRITWDGVLNWQDTTAGAPLAVLNDLQMELLPNGTVFLSYGANVGNGGSADNEAIVGFSPGAGEPETLSVDWSAITSLDSGSAPAMTLASDARPILGTTINVSVDRIPQGSIVAGVFFGTQVLNPGIPLGGLVGIPGDLYTSLDTIVTGVFPGTSYSVPLIIPVSTALSGASIAGQGFVMLNAAFVNPLNASVSSAVELKMGTD